MKKTLKKKDKESLSGWCKRLSDELNMTEEQSEALREVAIKAYIVGVHDGTATTQKYLIKED